MSFEKLRAQGAFLVSATLQEGRLIRLRVTAGGGTLQIVETPDELRERILNDLKQQHRRAYHAQDRTDFCVIHTGGRPPGYPPLKITRDNADQLIDALCECMQTAADFWAEHTRLPTGPNDDGRNFR